MPKELGPQRRGNATTSGKNAKARLEEAQERQVRERRWEPRIAARNYMHHGSQEEEQNWRVHNFEERRHQHQHQPKNYFPCVKLPSFSGESDPNVYLGWKAKVEQIFNVY